MGKSKYGKDADNFDNGVHPEQYTSAFADQVKLAADEAKKAAEKKAIDNGTYIPSTASNAPVALKSVFPVVCYIPDSPR
ncbi:hypothetical protein B0H14DRAFT_3452939 [Mycena olivaceomarginata]|nr:hypothetical protein B0H14DRAFT_3452939 [Mycena olivaceomarginata]